MPSTGRVNFGFIDSTKTSKACAVEANDEIPLSKWSHVAVRYDGKMTGYIYIDGRVRKNCLNGFTLNSHLNIKTVKNFIGKSNWNSDTSAEPNSLPNLVLDELKFYNRFLNATEIQSDLHSYFSFLPTLSSTPKCSFGCYKGDGTYLALTGIDLDVQKTITGPFTITSCQRACSVYLYAGLRNGYKNLFQFKNKNLTKN